jgi:hypothetical protein
MDIIRYYQSPFEKVRLGNKITDGGYVICKIPNLEYTLFLSGGIGNDVSFEEEFLEEYANKAEAHVYDATVEGLPHGYEDLKIQFHKTFIGGEENNTTTTLKSFLKRGEGKGIFVKMDIEEGEYAWLDSLTDDELSSIDQMVLEIHMPWGKFSRLQTINRLHSFFYLFHFHPNNCIPPLRFYDGTKLSEVFEFTLVAKRHCQGLPLTPNKDPVPSPLDRPSVIFRPTEQFEGPPYTF